MRGFDTNPKLNVVIQGLRLNGGLKLIMKSGKNPELRFPRSCPAGVGFRCKKSSRFETAILILITRFLKINNRHNPYNPTLPIFLILPSREDGNAD